MLQTEELTASTVDGQSAKKKMKGMIISDEELNKLTSDM